MSLIAEMNRLRPSGMMVVYSLALFYIFWTFPPLASASEKVTLQLRRDNQFRFTGNIAAVGIYPFKAFKLI